MSAERYRRVGNHLHSEYSAALGRLFDLMPKTVLAALTVSLAMKEYGDDIPRVQKALLDEWRVLFQQQIIAQPPPRTDRCLEQPRA